MWNGLIDLDFWGLFGVTMLLTQTTIASVTLYLHRGQAHKALDFHPVLSHFFRFWLWLTTGIKTKEWAAVHRKHHAKCETDMDPHSPQILGIQSVLFFGLYHYRQEAKKPETLKKYGHGTPDDFVENRLYTPFSQLGILLMLALNVLLFGVYGVLVWLTQMIWIPLFAAGVINGIGHYWGYRNFASPDASRNIFPWGFFIGGEELHNNHHTYATSAKFSVKPWELDIGWMYIRLLRKLRLVTVKRSLPKVHRNLTKAIVDHDTLMAVIGGRFQLMSQYSKTVIVPTVKAERRKLGKKKEQLLSKASKLLTPDQRYFHDIDFDNLKKLLDSNQQLKVIHQFQQQLQSIWSQTHASKDDLLKALQDWCKRAEQTGIRALEEFASAIKTYTLVEPRQA